MTEESAAEDERLPYWVELWPASLTLASWLEMRREDIRGRLCLDLGCGLGFTALVGQWLGARVLGADYERTALTYASANARLNGTRSPLWAVMDWRNPALQPASCAYVWAGDILYERRFVRPLLDFLHHVLAEEGTAWIAEPERTVYTLFLRGLDEEDFACRRVFREKVPALYGQKSLVTVNLWEIRKKAAVPRRLNPALLSTPD
ncbi:MAG: 50S ribosomal protein L11 methyltransferase [Desulfovibrio sp.]|nr:50S ribosomal protein L11 methyltransferase [Desulfovibrio sp.]